MHSKVEICGINTAKLKVLKNEETMELLRRTKEGDRDAREALISGNLRLVLSVIQKFSGRGENADDLFQVGCVGLIKAIDNFDITQPVRFSTYGVPMTFRCPKRKDTKNMTRKLALQEAIKIIEKSPIGKQRKEDIIKGLQLCVNELPFAKWSEAAIFDACEQHIEEHGYIRLRDFDCAGLPSHPTIKNRFGITAKEFRDQYFPLPDTPALQPKYRVEDKDQWNAMFVREFHRIQCTSEQHYNKSRTREAPVWQTMAQLNGVRTWHQLLKVLKLCTYKPSHLTLSVSILPP